jgi:hypothetical protein
MPEVLTVDGAAEYLISVELIESAGCNYRSGFLIYSLFYLNIFKRSCSHVLWFCFGAK